MLIIVMQRINLHLYYFVWPGLAEKNPLMRIFSKYKSA